jgi:hypothetical protein
MRDPRVTLVPIHRDSLTRGYYSAAATRLVDHRNHLSLGERYPVATAPGTDLMSTNKGFVRFRVI